MSGFFVPNNVQWKGSRFRKHGSNSPIRDESFDEIDENGFENQNPAREG